MERTRSRPEGGNGFLRRAVALLALAGVAGAVGSAQAAPSTKYYGASITPATVAPQSTTAFTLTLRNCGGGALPDCSPASTQSLGSANVTVPAGFTNVAVGTVKTDTGADWTSSSCLGDGTTCGASPNNVVQLRSPSSAAALAPGHAVTATVTATAPCSLATYTWATKVKQSNDFNGPPGNVFTNSGSDPTTTVAASGSTAIDHFTIALPASPFTATAGTAFSPTITAKDACNNTVTGFTGSLGTVTGTLGSTDYPSPGGSSPSYPASVDFTNGVATPSVTAVSVAPQSPATSNTLTFSASGYSSRTSDPFTVAPASPDHVLFTGQPLSGPFPGSPNWQLNTNGQLTGTLTTFGTQVTIYDAFGNVATQASSGKVTLALNQPPTTSGGGGSLNVTSATPSAGVATFSGLTVDKTGVGYTLTAGYGSGVTPATSDPFNIYLNIPTCVPGTDCSTPQLPTDGNTQIQGTAGGGTFTFFAVGAFDAAGLNQHLGCQYFNSVYSKVGGGGILEGDSQAAVNGQVVGSKTFTYYVNNKLIKARYGVNVGQQVIPICAGAQRAVVQLDASGNPQVVPVPCTSDPAGPWMGKQLDANGLYTGALTPALCDPNDGLWWGILPSFQDYNNGIVAGTQPVITGWNSTTINGTTYRYFVVAVPSPWDYQMGG